MTLDDDGEQAVLEADEAPFFICLERSLSTTAKWNLKHFLKTRFTAF